MRQLQAAGWGLSFFVNNFIANENVDNKGLGEQMGFKLRFLVGHRICAVNKRRTDYCDLFIVSP